MSEAISDISQASFLDNIPFGFIQVDLKGQIIYANASAFELLEMDESSLIGAPYNDLPWDQFDEQLNLLKEKDHTFYQALEEKTVTGIVRGLRINGKMKWFSVNASPFYDEHGKLVGAVTNFVDVSDKKELEETIRIESDRYKILLENIHAVVWESEVDSLTFAYISPKVEELFGYDKDEWLEEGFWQSIIHPDDRQSVVEFERTVTSNYELEYRLIHKDGTVRWVNDHVEVVKENDETIKLRGLIVDINEKKEAEAKIEESRERYKRLITEAPYAINIYDNEGLLVAANSKCQEYWLLPVNDLVGSFNIFNNDIFTSEKAINRIKKAFKGESGEVTTTINLPHADNQEKVFRIKYFPLLNRYGQLDNVVFMTEDITGYVQAEEKTKEEELLKQGILDALGDAILVINNDGLIVNINQSLTKYLEKQPYKGLIIGASIFDFINKLEESQLLEEAIKSILNQRTKFFDHEMRLVDHKWYNLRVTPLIEKYGAVISLQNINTRKEIEMALEKSLKKYRTIYNRAPVMMHSINKNLDIISVSDFWLDKMGYERNEVIGKSPVEFMTEPSKASIKENLKTLFEEGEVRNIEYQYIKKSGEIMEVLLSAVAEYDEEGNFERSITGMIDVTDQKAAERQLQESQTRLLESQRISKIGNYELDIETGEFIPSSEMSMMMGFDKSHRHMSVIEKLIHPDDLDEFKIKLEKALANGMDFFHIYRIFHLKSQKVRWISGRGRMVKNEKGHVTKMIGTVQDISEQRAAEDKIKRLSDRVLLATEIANLGVWEYDRDTNEIYWEDQMYSIFTNFDSPVGIKEVSKLLPEEDLSIIEENLRLIRTGVNFLEGEVRVEIDGQMKYLRSFTRVLRLESGKYKGMVGVVYDITDDKKLQVELEASLDEKNVLIKEVHHRVKNNMQLISSIMALKSYDLKDDHSKAIFEEVNNRIKAMSVIHDKLYTFYNVSEIDVNEYLQHIAQELQVLLGTSAIRIEVESEKVIMTVDRALLIGLMVSELVSNAIKHSYKGGKEGIIKITFTGDGDKNTLLVLNDGNVVPEDALASKTGLGVSLIKTFVKQLHGEIQVDPRNGFKVDF